MNATSTPDTEPHMDGEDRFESREFYELMQAYRWARDTNQERVIDCFEAVKAFCRSES